MDVNSFLDVLIPAIIRIIGAGIICFASTIVIPWLKERRIWYYVVRFVDAADKLAETGEIEKGEAKFDYVVECLENAGVKVDSTVEAWIEAAVREADIAADKIKEAVKTTAKTTTKSTCRKSTKSTSTKTDEAKDQA